MQCFTTANPINHVKYTNKNGQYTGIRNTSNHVHNHAAIPTTHRLFHKLNSFNERSMGLSPSVLARIEIV